MTLTRYLIGLCLLGVSVGPVVLGANVWRRRLLPSFVGPPGWLASGVVTLATVVVVSELLGSVGFFRLLPVTASFAAVGFVALRLGRRAGEGAPTELAPTEPPIPPVMPPSRTGRYGAFLAMSVAALVSGEWSSRVIDSLRHGMATADTLWYHMPVAAHFVQDGWTSHLHVYGRSYITYFPATSELTHALGFMFLGSDILSPFLNMGWLALALFAGWCIGRPFGVAPVTLIGAAAVLATPQLLVDDAGSALNDVVGIALLLAAFALLAHAMQSDEKRSLPAAELACISLVAGLALGTKFTLIGPVGAFIIGMIAVGGRRPQVMRRTAICVAAVALGGAYWYLRNLFAVGSPLPTLHLGLGPLHLPTVPMQGTSSVSRFLFDGTAWRDYFIPGLGDAFGPAWWAIIGAVVTGLAMGARFGPGRLGRVLAFVGTASLLVFVFTPQVLGGTDVPRFFATNVRYAAVGLTLGLSALPLAMTRFGDRGLRLLITAYACIVIATQFGRGVWQRSTTTFAPMVRESSSMLAGAVIGITVFGIGLTFLVARARSPRPKLLGPAVLRSRPAVATSIVVALAFVAGSFGVSRFYLDRRYQKTAPLFDIYRWAQDAHDERIAAVNFTLPYPLFGRDLSNHVEYVLPDGIDDPSSQRQHCEAWRRGVNRSRYSYLVIASHGFPLALGKPRPSFVNQWTRSDPAAHLVMRFGGRVWLYRIDGQLDPQGCARATRRRVSAS